MRLIIVEDERPIAQYIERQCRTILQDDLLSVHIALTFEQAEDLMASQQFDLCLLDLNLSGVDGFELLQSAVARAFHTIIISANTDQAVRAFEFGVLDFIPKPFERERLAAALARYRERREQRDITARFLTPRKEGQNVVVPVAQIRYFKAAGVYVEAHLLNGKVEILDKTMDGLGEILPPRFVRIHRSYLVDLRQVAAYRHTGGGAYQVTLKNEEVLPLSRQKYRELHEWLNYG